MKANPFEPLIASDDDISSSEKDRGAALEDLISYIKQLNLKNETEEETEGPIQPDLILPSASKPGDIHGPIILDRLMTRKMQLIRLLENLQMKRKLLSIGFLEAPNNSRIPEDITQRVREFLDSCLKGGTDK